MLQFSHLTHSREKTVSMALIERILLVESDPDISDLIARQALQPLGYQVDVVGDVAAALKKSLQSSPDLVIANLNLPGLSGKDLLVALSSQGSHTPLVVIAEKGQEQALVQAFRLGATDVLALRARGGREHLDLLPISPLESCAAFARFRSAGNRLILRAEPSAAFHETPHLQHFARLVGLHVPPEGHRR